MEQMQTSFGFYPEPLEVDAGAIGIAAGVSEVFPCAEQRDDCFHVLYEMNKVRRKLERRAYAAIEREGEPALRRRAGYGACVLECVQPGPTQKRDVEFLVALEQCRCPGPGFVTGLGLHDADGTYALVASDDGAQVRVAFRDDDGYAETVVSDAYPSGGSITGGTLVPGPATGKQTILGTARVGETLSVATDGIADGNGLATATFRYQWIRVDGNTETDISGATSSAYRLVEADEEKQVRVRVGSTPDASLMHGAQGCICAASGAHAHDLAHRCRHLACRKQSYRNRSVMG